MNQKWKKKRNPCAFIHAPKEKRDGRRAQKSANNIAPKKERIGCPWQSGVIPMSPPTMTTTTKNKAEAHGLCVWSRLFFEFGGDTIFFCHWSTQTVLLGVKKDKDSGLCQVFYFVAEFVVCRGRHRGIPQEHGRQICEPPCGRFWGRSAYSRRPGRQPEKRQAAGTRGKKQILCASTPPPHRLANASHPVARYARARGPPKPQ